MASRLMDNLIAARLLYMLVTPFDKTDAYKQGIVDAKGKVLIPMKDLKSEAQKDAYNYLTRLVFNIKRLLNKLPGGESKLKSLVAALWLVKEQYENGNKISNAVLEEKFADIMKMMDNRVSLVEEEIIVNKFLEEDGVANVTNVTGAMVSTNEPKVYKKDVKSYKNRQAGVIAGMAKRAKPVEVK